MFQSLPFFLGKMRRVFAFLHQGENKTLMKCEIRKTGGVTLFSVQGDAVFNQLGDIREKVLGEIMPSAGGTFLLDLGGVVMIDSAGVGFIVSVYKAVVSINGQFAVIRPRGDVRSVLETVGLSPGFFNIHESEGEALKAL